MRRLIVLVLFAITVALPSVQVTAQPPTPTKPTSTPTPTKPTPTKPMPTPTPVPFLGGTPAPHLTGDLAMQTYSLDLYRRKGGLTAATVQGLAMPAEESLQQSGALIGGSLAGRVALSFEPPQTGPCAIRGLTFSDQRMIRLFYAPGTDPSRVGRILTHELFHQLQHDYYGARDHLKAENILLEGMAVWGTASYFRTADGELQYRANVRAALQAGTLLPLTTSLDQDCRTTTRNVIYDEWGSFVEYLIVTYGRPRFDAVYRSSRGRTAGLAGYQGVYGKPLAQLEREWRGWAAGQ